MTDYQKQRVYDVEHSIQAILDKVAASEDPYLLVVAGSTLIIPLERKFGRIEDIQAYVDLCCHVLKVVPPRVRARKTTHKAHYCAGEIAIPTNEAQAAGKTGWAMRETVVLHELAHHLARGDQHGAAFVGKFLSLIKEFMGSETWLLALSTFDSLGIDIKY
jgi:putative metallohydrolase (TIGR04338 family)